MTRKEYQMIIENMKNSGDIKTGNNYFPDRLKESLEIP